MHEMGTGWQHTVEEREMDIEASFRSAFIYFRSDRKARIRIRSDLSVAPFLLGRSQRWSKQAAQPTCMC